MTAKKTSPAKKSASAKKKSAPAKKTAPKAEEPQPEISDEEMAEQGVPWDPEDEKREDWTTVEDESVPDMTEVYGYQSTIMLGQNYIDRYTGFAGRATNLVIAIASQRVCIETLIEGKIYEEWIDAERLISADAVQAVHAAQVAERKENES